MSKYTTEVRYLCESLSGLTESTGYNGITAAITAAAPQIFSFDFPIWDGVFISVCHRRGTRKHCWAMQFGV